MHRSAILVLIVLSLSCNLLSQASSQTAPSVTGTKDAQAVSILNQVIAAAGGTQAVAAINDYKGSGTVIYNWTQPVQGNITVLVRGTKQFRSDSTLSDGVRSAIFNKEKTIRKSQDGVVQRFPLAGKVPNSNAGLHQTPLFPSSVVLPYPEALAALNDSHYSVSYKGLIQVEGHSVYDIQIRLVMPNSAGAERSAASNPTRAIQGAIGSTPTDYFTSDLFIDTQTLQVLIAQDLIPNHTIHQVRYSDFRVVNGVSSPFSIAEEMGGQRTFSIQFNQISFNVGLQDADFDL